MEYTRIIIRHDTSENWVSANPILAEGEYGHDMTVNRVKVGDGETDWNHLGWSTASYADITNINSELIQHENNSTIHVTQTEKDSWDSKSNFSGDYNDLTNKPEIPTVSDAQITFKQGNTTVGTITLNQSSGSVLTFSEGGGGEVSWDNISDKPDFATVATSGEYDDLLNKPDIPVVPTDVSAFNNDAGYITNADVMNYKAFPEGWHTSGTLSQLISDINADTNAEPGMSYMATVSFSDLPASMVQAEIKVDVMDEMEGLGKVLLFTITSSNTSPYHWEYTSAYGASGDWRSFVVNGSLATVATSGSYTDLTDKPTIPTVNDATLTINQGGVLKGTFTANASSNVTIDLGEGLTSVSWSDVTDKPNFATVATSGSYDDLTNTPTIPAAQVQSDWNQSNNQEVDYIKNKPSLAAVATSGAYSDLSGKPSLAAVATSGDYGDLLNKPTIPAAQVQSDWNQSNNQEVDYIKNKPSLATVATSGSYTDLTNTPSIPAAQVNSDWNAVSGVAQILNKPALSAVATSGAYSDLSGTPNLATVATSGSYADLTNKPSIPAAQVNSDWNSTSGVSEILNKPTILDSNDFKTLNSESLVGTGNISIKSYQQATQTVASGTTSLTPAENTVYTFAANPTALTITAVPNSQYETDIYFTAGGNFTLTLPANTVVYGSTSIVSGEHYAVVMKDGKVVVAHDGETTPTVAWNDITGKPNFASVATSGSYTDLSDKPSIPAAQVNSDWNASSGVAQILNKPSLATVATSGSYEDLTNKPSIPSAQVNSDWNAVSGVAEILNKPTLATVATSGSYEDLTNKPTIPAAQVQSDWNAVSGMGEILNKPSLAKVATSGAYSDLTGTPSLATVATSGSYTDLSNTPSIPAAQVNSDWDAVSGVAQILNKPTIPTVNNATLTITQGGVSKGTFTANASSDVTIALDAGGGSVAWNDITDKPTFATVATSGSYNDLSNTPSIPAAQVQSDWNASSGMGEILNKPNLSTVATSGAYSDLTGTPNLATVATSGLYSDLTGTPTIPTVNNATLTITEGGTSKGTFTANASSDVTIALSAPGDANVQADWNETDTASDSYIQNKPTIPTVNNATLTITQGGTTKGTFTANASSDVTIALDAGGGNDMEEYEITFTLDDDSTVTKTFWVKPEPAV